MDRSLVQTPAPPLRDVTDRRLSPLPPRSGAAVRPADAASLILVDRTGPQPRVLMGERHRDHRFMPGRLVFPGGRLDRSDRFMRAYGALPVPTERNLLARSSRATPDKARALALCAIREMAEETGFLLGEAECGVPPASGEGWAAFAAHAVFPSLETLHFVARAITPPGMARRFDTRFFAAEATGIVRRLDGVVHDGAELVRLDWLTIEEAGAGNVADVTRIILDELAQRLEAGLDRDLPVPFFYERRGRWLRDEI